LKLLYLFTITTSLVLLVLFVLNDDDADKQQIKQSMSDHFEKKTASNRSEAALKNPESELVRIQDHLFTIANCEENQDCPFADTDPKAVYFSIGQAIKNDLAKLAIEFSDKPNPELAVIARQYVQFENDHVRESALQLMSSQPPETENVDAIISGLSNSHDASIYQMAMVEFQRYPEQASKQKIQTFFTTTLQQGGFYAKRQVAEGLLPFLNASNISQFRELQATLPANQAHSKLLLQNIEEFELMASGG
jgi:hypothetical protein